MCEATRGNIFYLNASKLYFVHSQACGCIVQLILIEYICYFVYFCHYKMLLYMYKCMLYVECCSKSLCDVLRNTVARKNMISKATINGKKITFLQAHCTSNISNNKFFTIFQCCVCFTALMFLHLCMCFFLCICINCKKVFVYISFILFSLSFAVFVIKLHKYIFHV